MNSFRGALDLCIYADGEYDAFTREWRFACMQITRCGADESALQRSPLPMGGREGVGTGRSPLEAGTRGGLRRPEPLAGRVVAPPAEPGRNSEVIGRLAPVVGRSREVARGSVAEPAPEPQYDAVRS